MSTYGILHFESLLSRRHSLGARATWGATVRRGRSRRLRMGEEEYTERIRPRVSRTRRVEMRNPCVDRTGRARARGRQLDGAAGVEAENVTMTDVVGGAGAEVEICAERGARVGGGTDVTVVATTATVVATRRRRVGRGSFWQLLWRTRRRRDWASFHWAGLEGDSVCPAGQLPLV